MAALKAERGVTEGMLGQREKEALQAVGVRERERDERKSRIEEKRRIGMLKRAAGGVGADGKRRLQ